MILVWEIQFSIEAVRDLSKLDAKTAARIIKKLEESSKNPVHFFTRLAGHDDYKLRVGDYRVIALLLHDLKVIFIEKIGHRKNIYK